MDGSDRGDDTVTSGLEAANPPRAVLWDLDGTLVDSAELHWEAWRATLRAEGTSVTQEQFVSTFGWRNDAILTRWLGPMISREDMQRIGDAKETRYRELVSRRRLVALPGAAEWLARLAREGWRQAVASSAPRANVEVVTKAMGLAEYFEATVAAEDVRLGKPEPEVFLTAAMRLNTNPSRCVVVEDAAAGVEAASRAGMASIGVGSPSLTHADLAVASLVDLDDDAFDRLIVPNMEVGKLRF